MSKKPSGRSIVSNFGVLSAVAASEPTVAFGDGVNETDASLPSVRVGAGIIGATKRSLSELREERELLHEKLATGGAIQLDPSLIDPSPFSDRLSDDGEGDFEAFKRTIEEEGQKVPIVVRPHPDTVSRFQVVFGHRRVRAARELGIAVEGIVKHLSDQELAIAQGLENSARQDLSWIERAVFVLRLDQAGMKARDIRAALSVSDAELARFRAVTGGLPVDIIESIGRAPKAGRPRWMALVKAVSSDDRTLLRVRETLTAVKDVGSDERFKRALEVAVAAPAVEPAEMTLTDEAGTAIGIAVFGKRDIRLTVSKNDAGAFSEFIRRELPALIERFAAQRRD